MDTWDFVFGLLKGLLIFGIILLIVCIVTTITLYIITSYLMEKHSKEKYGSSSIIVWIPVARLYYLGKEIHSDYLGYGLVILRVLLLTNDISGNVFFISIDALFKIVVYGMFIYLYFKYKDLLDKNKKAIIKKRK